MKIEELFEKLYDSKLKDTLEDFYYNIKYGIKNIIKWLPIIWLDRDWDYYFLMRMMQHKMKFMEKSMRKSMLLNGPVYAKQIKDCIILLERLINDEYYSEAFKEHDKKFGDIEIEEIPHIKDDGIIDDDLVEIEIKRKNVNTDQDKIDEEKSSKDCFRRSRQKQLNDLHNLFNSMKSNIFHWWC